MFHKDTHNAQHWTEKQQVLFEIPPCFKIRSYF